MSWPRVREQLSCHHETKIQGDCRSALHTISDMSGPDGGHLIVRWVLLSGSRPLLPPLYREMSTCMSRCSVHGRFEMLQACAAKLSHISRSTTSHSEQMLSRGQSRFGIASLHACYSHLQVGTSNSFAEATTHNGLPTSVSR